MYMFLFTKIPKYHMCFWVWEELHERNSGWFWVCYLLLVLGMPVLSLHMCMCTMFMPVAWKNQKILSGPQAKHRNYRQLWIVDDGNEQTSGKGSLGKQISNVYIEYSHPISAIRKKLVFFFLTKNIHKV